MRATPRLLIVGLAGSLGGAINAWLCYAELPVPAYAFYAGNAFFTGSIVPAGALHGGILALSAMGLYLLRARMDGVARLVAAIPLGAATGVCSWAVLSLSIFGAPSGHDADVAFYLAGIPLFVLGLVAPCYYLGLLCVLPRRRDLGAHLLRGILAGVVGSAWFWIYLQKWYLAPLHGVIWGTLVGAAAWWIERETRGSQDAE